MRIHDTGLKTAVVGGIGGVKGSRRQRTDHNVIDDLRDWLGSEQHAEHPAGRTLAVAQFERPHNRLAASRVVARSSSAIEPPIAVAVPFASSDSTRAVTDEKK